MFSGLLLVVAIVAGMAVLSAVAGVISLLFWIVLLPFKLLGLVFRGIAMLLLLPLLLLLGLALGAIVGIPLLIALAIPLLPLLLVVAGIVWLARRGMRSAAHSS